MSLRMSLLPSPAGSPLHLSSAVGISFLMIVHDIGKVSRKDLSLILLLLYVFHIPFDSSSGPALGPSP